MIWMFCQPYVGQGSSKRTFIFRCKCIKLAWVPSFFSPMLMRLKLWGGAARSINPVWRGSSPEARVRRRHMNEEAPVSLYSRGDPGARKKTKKNTRHSHPIRIHSAGSPEQNVSYMSINNSSLPRYFFNLLLFIYFLLIVWLRICYNSSQEEQ